MPESRQSADSTALGSCNCIVIILRMYLFLLVFFLPFPVCALGGHLVGEVIVIAGAGAGTAAGAGTERVLRAHRTCNTHAHAIGQRAACRMPHATWPCPWPEL